MGAAIRPSEDLRNHDNYNEISKQCNELLKTLAEADDDLKNGRVALIQDSFDDLRTSLLERQQTSMEGRKVGWENRSS